MHVDSTFSTNTTTHKFSPQGSVLLEVSPDRADDQLRIDLTGVAEQVDQMQRLGFRGLKLNNLYLDHNNDTAYFYANDFERLAERLGGNLSSVAHLADALHAANMTLLVDIPVHGANRSVEPELDFRITKAIQFWAGAGVDGIALVGLEQYGADPYVTQRVAAWSTDFEKYSRSSQRIFITSYLFPESIDQAQQQGWKFMS